MPDALTEIWKPIVGYEGLYEISNMGRVRSLDREYFNPAALGGGKFLKLKGRIRKPNVMKGYYCISLANNGKKKVFRIHRLVAEHFICPQPTPDHQINHIDGDKSNNRFDNLEWVLPIENTRHAIANGLRHKPTEETKRKIGEATKQRWLDSDYRNSQSERMKARWDDEQTRNEIISNMQGKTRTPEQRAHYAAIPRATRRVQNITTGEIFSSCKQAAEKYNVTPTAISSCANGLTNHCAGYEWRYLD